MTSINIHKPARAIRNVRSHIPRNPAKYFNPLIVDFKNVVWVEANPEIYEKLVVNIKPYGHRAFCFCVGDENKETVLHVSNNGSQSSSVLELGTHKIQHPDVHYVKDIDVHMFRGETFFAGSPFFADHDGDSDENNYSLEGIDFLNVDLQGFEGNALRGMGELLRQFKWIYCEINKAEVYLKGTLVTDLDLFLLGFGFKRVQTANWIGDWTDALYIKNGL